MKYARMKTRHTRLLGRYKNAVVESLVETIIDPGDDFNPPVTSTEYVPFDAIVSGVGADTVDGTQIQSTDLEVQTQLDPAPEVGDVIRVDGDQVSIQQITPLREGIGYVMRVRG